MAGGSQGTNDTPARVAATIAEISATASDDNQIDQVQFYANGDLIGAANAAPYSITTNLPAGTYEREFGKEGFFGPATQIYHAHPPTSWSDWDGPLKPRAFDLNKLPDGARSPWAAAPFLHNGHLRVRYWREAGAMDRLVRNGDGDELLFIHEGAGDLFCDFGHLAFGDGDYILLPRGTMWRVEATAPVTALLIEATNDSYRLPEKGLVGSTAITPTF